MLDKILNITNGDAFNNYFLSKFEGRAVPFCEDMMDGDTVLSIYSNEFINLRSGELNVTVETYKSKMQAYDALKNKDYSALSLWFGKDTFCQMNLLMLLAYLEQIEYCGEVWLNYIDDETFDVIEANIKVELGIYENLYQKILIDKCKADDVGILLARSIELFFDYHSNNGVLAEIVKENSEREELEIIRILLENSKDYGLSDIQAQKLIKKYK